MPYFLAQLQKLPQPDVSVVSIFSPTAKRNLTSSIPYLRIIFCITGGIEKSCTWNDNSFAGGIDDDDDDCAGDRDNDNRLQDDYDDAVSTASPTPVIATCGVNVEIVSGLLHFCWY